MTRLLWVWPDADMTCQQRGHLLSCEFLKQSGIECSILTNETSKNKDIISLWGGMVRIIKSAKGPWTWWAKAGMALRLLDPHLPADLVMMLPWYYWVKTAIIAKKLYGRPYAVWLDTYTYARQKTVWSRIYHELRYGLLLQNADLVIAESPECYEIAASRLSHSRVIHIPMPLSLRRFKSIEVSWAADSNQPIRTPVILFIGRISPEKGPHLLIDAFTQVAQEFPEWKLKIVGPVAQEIPKWIREAVGVPDQDYLRLLMDKVEAAGLQDRVEFIPGLYGVDLYRAYAESSIYVLPSFWEGVPTTVLEAMYFGGAIIASNVGIVPYQLNYGQCGMIVEPNDAPGLAVALRRMMLNETDRSRFMQNSRQRMIETFSWESNIHSLEKEIRRLISRSLAQEEQVQLNH